jgi:hypothetical protein
MSVKNASPATIPFQSSQRRRRPWQPSDRDHLIFQWVKFEGQRQTWVAQQFNIDQSTVSRIIQRYERWQAHAQPGDAGRLAHAERLRAQRWLTYERNELMLAACLRIAGDVEGFADVSKSTVFHAASQPNKELEVRTQHARIDRSGVAARFLRLAFRINMEQLKLVELDPLPPLPPLSPDEIEDLEPDESTTLTPSTTSESADDLVAPVHTDDARSRASSLVEPPTTQDCGVRPVPDNAPESSAIAGEAPLPTTIPLPDDPPTVPPPKLHKMHNCIHAETPLTADQLCLCAPHSNGQEISAQAFDPPLKASTCPSPPNPRPITTSSSPCSFPS